MKRFLLSVFAATFTLGAFAKNDMYLSMEDQTSASTNGFKRIAVSVMVENDVPVTNLDANVVLGAPLTCDNFAWIIPNIKLDIADKGERTNVVQSEIHKVLKESNRLYLNVSSDAPSYPDYGALIGNNGAVFTFYFDASSITESGDYTISLKTVNELSNPSNLNYSTFMQKLDYHDDVENKDYTTDIFAIDKDAPYVFTYHLDIENGTVKAVAAPIKIAVTEYSAANTTGTPNAAYDVTTGYTPVENSLLVTEDANGKDIPGNNVVYKEGGVYKCKNLVIDDAFGFYSPVDFTAENVSNNRTSTGMDIITICLPYAVPVDQFNGEPAILAGLDGAYLEFSKTAVVTATEAYKPYIIDVTSDGKVVADLTNVDVKATPATMQVEAGGVTHAGVMNYKEYKHADDPSTDYYAFAIEDNKFHRGQTVKVPAYRTVIMLAHSDAGVGLKSTDMSSLGIKFIDGDVPTGAEVVEAEAGKVNVFDALGRAVRLNVEADKATEGLKDGIYIVNGQKVIVKNK
ncbi:MAG: hypothetical protein MJZ24_09865 [Paludibacteraceae bacterium]|nr:hypothetical protein [Paludibacteraceae bacterium]